MQTQSNLEQDTAPALLQIKIIYWGPGEAGKTTNFLRLKEIFHQYSISNGFSIATTDDRTLWNDSIFFKFYLPKFHLNLVVNVATTTGQERFLSTREYILQNSDGVIFVADSEISKLDENIRSFEELVAFTRRNHVPILIQLNKRDITKHISTKEFKSALDLPNIDRDADGFFVVYEGVANDKINPLGVKEIFLDIIQKILLAKLRK